MLAEHASRFSCREPLMPFKLHSKGRGHIPRQRHRATNWREIRSPTAALEADALASLLLRSSSRLGFLHPP